MIRTRLLPKPAAARPSMCWSTSRLLVGKSLEYDAPPVSSSRIEEWRVLVDRQESETTRRALRVGVDIGGTFTDLFLFDAQSGEFFLGKVLTTPEDPSRAVQEGI